MTIPNTVTTIRDNAFRGCTGLKKVIVKDIAAWCAISSFSFYENSNGFYVYNNPLFYAHHLFSDENTEITDLVIPNNVVSIGDFAFVGCNGLTSITIPHSVTSIGIDSFRECPGLKKVIVKDIASWCAISFSQYYGKRSEYSNPLRIAQHLFSDENTEITNLVIPSSVTSINYSVFEGCIGLSSVTIPYSVTDIGEFAFSGCSGLGSITIGNSVTSIEGSAFSGCNSLASVTIPNSVTSIGGWAFRECSSLTSVTIPSSVKNIGYNAFYDCSGLASLTIGNSVTSIGERAFHGCNGLTLVISKIENPCLIPSNCFPEDVFNNVTLYVPMGTTDKYKSTDYWSKFLFIEEGEPTSVTHVLSNELLISAQKSTITVRGVQNGQPLTVYTADGKMLGSATIKDGQASISTNLQRGEIAIVKVGSKSVKIKM